MDTIALDTLLAMPGLQLHHNDPEGSHGTSFKYSFEGTHIRFDYFHGGYLVYQCLSTDSKFKSTNYSLRTFVASNGVSVGSKNSPIVSDPDHIFLQGAFPEFDLKPAVHYVANQATFFEMVHRFVVALNELHDHLATQAAAQSTEEAVQ